MCQYTAGYRNTFAYSYKSLLDTYLFCLVFSAYSVTLCLPK